MVIQTMHKLELKTGNDIVKGDIIRVYRMQDYDDGYFKNLDQLEKTLHHQ